MCGSHAQQRENRAATVHGIYMSDKVEHVSWMCGLIIDLSGFTDLCIPEQIFYEFYIPIL